MPLANLSSAIIREDELCVILFKFNYSFTQPLAFPILVTEEHFNLDTSSLTRNVAIPDSVRICLPVEF